jgi:membrane dipeptidase
MTNSRAAFLAFAFGIFPAISSATSEKANALHFSSIVIDTHDDTTQRLLDPKFDLGERHLDGNIDIPRMREGGLGGIFFSIWIPGAVTGPLAIKRALDQIDTVREQVRKHPKDLVLATTAHEVEAAHKEGKIAALMGIEGGHMIDNDLSALRSFAALGVRYMTLTHTKHNDWADASTDKAVHNGLTQFGKDVVHEMNRLGVMVDISHVSDKTFYDALESSRAPIFASHSSARALCDAPRNMSDDMIRALARKGGVIQINYHIGFLSQEFANTEKAHPEMKEQREAEADKVCGDDEACGILLVHKRIGEAQKSGKLPKVDWSRIIDHIDHAVKIAGVDHVGLGSDFDGAIMPSGMEDVSKLPKITEALLNKGYSESDVRKILGGNTLRLMREVERVSREMNAGSN